MKKTLKFILFILRACMGLSLLIFPFRALMIEAIHKIRWALLLLPVVLACGCRTTDLLEQSKQLLVEGRYAEAVELQTKLVRRYEADPSTKAGDLANACFWRGYTYDSWNDKLKSLRRANPDAAKYEALAAEDYERAIRSDAGFVEAYYNLALIRFDKEKWDEAILLFEKVLQLRPSETDALGYIVEVHFRRGNYEAAARAAARFMQSSAAESVKEAKRLGRTGDTDGAIRQLHAALDARPDMPEAHLELGMIFLLKKRDPARALHHLEKFVRVTRDDALRDGAQKLIDAIRQSGAEDR